MLRDRQDVRNQAGLAVGALLAAFGAQTWISSSMFPSLAIDPRALEGSLFAGILFAIPCLAAATTVGWICGGWVLRSDAYSAAVPGHPLSSFLRQLALVGALLLSGMALGAWPLAGGLILVAGAAIGSLARLGREGFRFLSDNC
jgi:hypothetical protein